MLHGETFAIIDIHQISWRDFAQLMLIDEVYFTWRNFRGYRLSLLNLAESL